MAVKELIHSFFPVLWLALGPFGGLSAQHTQFVNPFIGTDGTGHTFPGPSMPFGMVQPGPDNTDHGWNHTSGYQYQDTMVMGFSQTRFSGTGISEMGDILLLPFAGDYENSMKCILIKNSEQASVGYYAVRKKDAVKVELTCSERVAFHRYTFPTPSAQVYVSFQHGLRFLTDSLVLESNVKIRDNRTITGYCHTKNWVERKYFFMLTFDQPFRQAKQLPRADKEAAPRYIFSFKLRSKRTLQVKIALSTTSETGAEGNLQAEIPHWNFEKIRQNAETIWNGYLGRIDIETDTKKQKEIFYTALYHFFLQPANIADTDGRYRGADDNIAQAPGGAYYSTLSIWDIYRAAFPLLQIIAPERVDGIINTLLLHHEASGFLPIWTAWGQDNYCMIGNHAIPMILSACNNGFRGFDRQAALRAMVETSIRPHINSDWELYNRYGYYPFDSLDNEAVSRTLESGFDDWCVAEMAAQMGDRPTADTFFKRATYYRNLFDPETRMFRGKDSNGNWRTPFNPFAATSPMNNPGDYTEANAWQYFWTPAQYDLNGLQQLLGGNTDFTRQLNDFFTLKSLQPNKFLGQEAMIGQYAHGNEPSHHIVYLYRYTDTPHTGQRYIHRIVSEFYSNTPDGMIGNDDCGQMSAWYIFACLGFYPVNSASGAFVLGAPQIKQATLHLPRHKSLEILSENSAPENIYTEKVSWNGLPVVSPSILYQQLMNGGKLVFTMQNQ